MENNKNDILMAKFNAVFRLGNIDVDPKTDQLKCADKQIEIQSMAMKVLCYFCEHSDRLITRDNLRDDVWKNTATSNHTINNHIYSLRRNLGKLDPDVKYIHTVTGGGTSGYRLSETLVHYDDTQLPNDESAELVTVTTPTVANDKKISKKTQRFGRLMFAAIVAVVCFTVLGYSQFIQTTDYKDVQQLTDLPGREQSASVAADGNFFVYANKKTKQQAWELFASSMDNPSKSVKVFNSEGNRDNFPSIAPSGQKIAFHRLKDGEEGIYVATFDRSTLKASQERRVIALEPNNLSTSISWLDETHFYYSIHEVSWAPKKIYLFDISSGLSEQVSSPALNSHGDFANTVSPDKQWMAILRADSYWDIELILYDITINRFIETGVKLSHLRLNVSFSDDSKSVYFIDSNGYLSRFDLASSVTTRISQQQYVGYWPLKIPGRNQFLLQQDWGLSSLTTEIVSVKNPVVGGDGTRQVVVNNGLAIRAIEGVNDGGFIFASVKPNRQLELWRYKEGKAYKLDEFIEKADYRYPLSLHWQQGSEQALLTVDGSCRSININTGKDSPLCPKGERLYAGTYSADLQSIYFATFDNNQSKAVKMAHTGYPIEPLPLLKNANMVRDGGKGILYYRIEPGNDIYQFDLTTQKSKKLIGRSYIANGYTTNDFVVVNDGIYFMDKPLEQSNAIYYYDFSSNKIRYLFDTPNLYPNIVLSDEQQLIYLLQSAHNDTHLLLLQ